MQFHHLGYVSGNPRVQPATGTGVNRADELPDVMDVLIVGAGPAGHITAAQLSQFPSIETRVIDRRGSRLELGHADGVQARSVETFQAFGFAERAIQEACHITPRCRSGAQTQKTTKKSSVPVNRWTTRTSSVNSRT